jgi:hypothetical protein
MMHCVLRIPMFVPSLTILIWSLPIRDAPLGEGDQRDWCDPPFDCRLQSSDAGGGAFQLSCFSPLHSTWRVETACMRQ